jgi:hypothetical protein
MRGRRVFGVWRCRRAGRPFAELEGHLPGARIGSVASPRHSRTNSSQRPVRHEQVPCDLRSGRRIAGLPAIDGPIVGVMGSG